jgi:hypothetical protein
MDGILLVCDRSAIRSYMSYHEGSSGRQGLSRRIRPFKGMAASMAPLSCDIGDGQGGRSRRAGRRAQRVRADDGTYIGCQASNVEFEAGNLTRKEATIIIQSVRALDAIKRYIKQHCSQYISGLMVQRLICRFHCMEDHMGSNPRLCNFVQDCFSVYDTWVRTPRGA